MLKLLNKLGLYTSAQYKKLLKDKDKVESDNEEMVYDFDKLMKKYNAPQLNCFFYKAVNECYNDSTKRYLLGRWARRLNGVAEN